MANHDDNDVMFQIREMLEVIQKEDPQRYKIILTLLQEVVFEYNSGRPRNVERKLYDMIDGETYDKKDK